MSAARAPQQRYQQQQQQRRPPQRQQLPETHGVTHEPICVKETRVCWIEFGVGIGCLVLGLILVFAGVSVDSSAVGADGGSGTKSKGVQAVTYIGVVLLIAGGILLVVFGVHFYRVKSRLDSAKAERFAQLGIRPASRYEAPPESNFDPRSVQLPRPPVLPLPARQLQEEPQEQPRAVTQTIAQPPGQPRSQPPAQQVPISMSSSRLQPMPSYREGAFYNLGFLGDETDKPSQPQANKTSGFSRGGAGPDVPPAGAAPAGGGFSSGGVPSSRSYHTGLAGAAGAPRVLPTSTSGQDFHTKATTASSTEQARKTQPRYRAGPLEPVDSWQRPPEESPPPQRSPPPQYARDPFPLLHQPRDQLRDQYRSQNFYANPGELEVGDQDRNRFRVQDEPRGLMQSGDPSRSIQPQFRTQMKDQPPYINQTSNQQQFRDQHRNQQESRDQPNQEVPQNQWTNKQQSTRNQQPQFNNQNPRDQRPRDQQLRDQQLRDQQLRDQQPRNQQQFRDQQPRDQQPRNQQQFRDQQPRDQQPRDQQQFRDQHGTQQAPLRDQQQPRNRSNYQPSLRDPTSRSKPQYNKDLPEQYQSRTQARADAGVIGGQSRDPVAPQSRHSGYRSSQI